MREGTFADQRRGSRHERGYGAAWDKVRQEVMRRDAGICQPCMTLGDVHPGQQVDHKVNKAEARRLGWSAARYDHPSNLQCICEVAHREKTQREAAAGRRRLLPVGEAA